MFRSCFSLPCRCDHITALLKPFSVLVPFLTENGQQMLSQSDNFAPWSVGMHECSELSHQLSHLVSQMQYRTDYDPKEVCSTGILLILNAISAAQVCFSICILRWSPQSLTLKKNSLWGIWLGFSYARESNTFKLTCINKTTKSLKRILW